MRYRYNTEILQLTIYNSGHTWVLKRVGWLNCRSKNKGTTRILHSYNHFHDWNFQLPYQFNYAMLHWFIKDIWYNVYTVERHENGWLSYQNLLFIPTNFTTYEITTVQWIYILQEDEKPHLHSESISHFIINLSARK